MKPGRIILLVIIALFLVGLAVNFSGNASTYSTFETAKKTGKRVHIVGEWVNREATDYNPESDIFHFYLKDTLDAVEQVRYHDPKPMNFETAEKVVIIGKYEKDEFVADKIIMKCPSKYEETDITAGEKKTM
jgi:cytochrome c-type biogenesis protein CcmE